MTVTKSLIQSIKDKINYEVSNGATSGENWRLYDIDKACFWHSELSCDHKYRITSEITLLRVEAAFKFAKIDASERLVKQTYLDASHGIIDLREHIIQILSGRKKECNEVSSKAKQQEKNSYKNAELAKNENQEKCIEAEMLRTASLSAIMEMEKTIKQTNNIKENLTPISSRPTSQIKSPPLKPSSQPIKENEYTTPFFNKLFGIGTHGAFFVWIFWGVLGMLIAPPLGTIIVMVLLFVNVIREIDSYRVEKKKKMVRRTGASSRFEKTLHRTPTSNVNSSSQKTRVCPRCHGHGYIMAYKHIEDGICFRCRGKGK